MSYDRNAHDRAGSLYDPNAAAEIEWDTSEFRRLPVYLLLDCSSSMTGMKIQQVNDGVQTLYRELMNDPRAVETVHICVIHFASSAAKTALVPIASFQPPQFAANGSTALGEALRLLNQSLDTDLKAVNMGQRSKGDYKPLIFLLTDGQPTDAWQAEAQKLKSRTTMKSANVIALAIGADADPDMLKQVTPTVLKMDTVTPELLHEFFVWVSQSVKQASKSIARAGEAGQGASGEAQAATPPPPLGIDLYL